MQMSLDKKTGRKRFYVNRRHIRLPKIVKDSILSTLREVSSLNYNLKDDTGEIKLNHLFTQECIDKQSNQLISNSPKTNPASSRMQNHIGSHKISSSYTKSFAKSSSFAGPILAVGLTSPRVDIKSKKWSFFENLDKLRVLLEDMEQGWTPEFSTMKKLFDSLDNLHFTDISVDEIMHRTFTMLKKATHFTKDHMELVNTVKQLKDRSIQKIFFSLKSEKLSSSTFYELLVNFTDTVIGLDQQIFEKETKLHNIIQSLKDELAEQRGKMEVLNVEILKLMDERAFDKNVIHKLNFRELECSKIEITATKTLTQLTLKVDLIRSTNRYSNNSNKPTPS